EEIPKLFDKEKMDELLLFFYPKQIINRYQLAKITALTFELAKKHDEVAIEIIQRVGMFLGYQTAGVIKQVSSENEEIPVVIGGRVFEEGSHHLIDEMKKYLIHEVPKAYLVRPMYTPMVGGYLR